MNTLWIAMATLLSGAGMLVIGTGLLFSVIGTQAQAADFPVVVTGLINSAYFAGFIFGIFFGPRVIRHVGHVRTFAALASMASTLPILHALWLEPMFWGVMRFITGVCLVGLYLVLESWLNVASPGAQRGKVFAAYMAVSGISLALGQWLVLFGGNAQFVPFAMVSVLFSFALLPITLNRIAEPEPAQTPALDLRGLFGTSPIAVIGSFASGMLSGAFYSLGQVFGDRIGMSAAGSATMVAAAILGGAAFQWPVGALSDRHDRRWVLLGCSAAAAAVALGAFVFLLDHESALIAMGVVYGALTFPIYGLSVAHANDLVPKDRVLQITGGLLLLHGLGATAGPTMAGALMDRLGPGSLMVYFAVVLLVLSGCARHYIRQRPLNRGEPGQKESFVAMVSSTPAVLQLDPRRPETDAQGATHTLRDP